PTNIAEQSRAKHAEREHAKDDQGEAEDLKLRKTRSILRIRRQIYRVQRIARADSAQRHHRCGVSQYHYRQRAERREQAVAHGKQPSSVDAGRRGVQLTESIDGKGRHYHWARPSPSEADVRQISPQ